MSRERCIQRACVTSELAAEGDDDGELVGSHVLGCEAWTADADVIGLANPASASVAGDDWDGDTRARKRDLLGCAHDGGGIGDLA